MKSRVIFSVLSAIVLLFTMAYADVPRMINYQGKLTTPEGALIDTTISMTFAIYADSVGTDSLWSEIQSSVVIEKGIFSVLLGSVNPIPDSVFTGGIRYLGVKAGDDSEMTPRRAIVAVAYAYRSVKTDTAMYSECLDKGPVVFQGVDNCDSSNLARYVAVTPPEGFSSVLLYAFAENSCTYQKARAADTVLGDLPSGVSSASTIQSISGVTGPPTTDEGFVLGQLFNPGVRYHRHNFSATVPFLYTHSHGIAYQYANVTRADGFLPANTTLWIDGVDRTADISWNTRNPLEEKEVLIDAQDITAWISTPGIHWIEIASSQAGRVRFAIVAR